jgi:tetratricopeptide (TPR) repeat protein
MRTFRKTSRWVSFLAVLTLAASASASFQQNQPLSRKLRSIARLYMAYGQYDKAEPYLLEAVQLSAGDSEKENAICLIDLATLYSYQDRLTESEALFRRGLSAQQKALGPDHPYVAHTLRNLTAVYLRQHRLDQAIQTLEWAFDIILKHHTPDNRILVPFYIDQANLLTQLGCLEEAESIFTEILEKTSHQFGQSHIYSAQIHQGLAELYVQAELYERAAEHLAKGLEIQKSIYGKNHRMLVDSYLLGAKICRLQGNSQQMNNYFDLALSSIPSGDTAAVARLYEKIEDILSDKSIIAAL